MEGQNEKLQYEPTSISHTRLPAFQVQLQTTSATKAVKITTGAFMSVLYSRASPGLMEEEEGRTWWGMSCVGPISFPLLLLSPSSVLFSTALR